MEGSSLGLDIQVNKAITGENAFAHSSGIHQDGLLKNRDVYEVIKPEDVGVSNMEMVLTARSGRHAFKDAIKNLGADIDKEIDFDSLFESFLELADKKKEVYDSDLIYLVEKHYNENNHNIDEKFLKLRDKLYKLESLQVISNDIFPTATVMVKRGDEVLKGSSTGDGPIDALYTAIKNLVKLDIELKEYKTNSMSRGKEALGRVSICVEYKNQEYFGKATDTDIIKSSALAFINAINSMVIETNN